MTTIFEQLEEYSGIYQGPGENHEGEVFLGEMKLFKGINCYLIDYKAVGKDGTLFHQEVTTIALTPDEKLCLWSINTNNPFMTQHCFRRREMMGERTNFVFGYNDPVNSRNFREEISLELGPAGSVAYNYSWGMPGGDFLPRSMARMYRQDNSFSNSNETSSTL